MSWSKDAEKALKKKQAELELLHQRCMFRVAAQTDVKSPVDTGRFRGNWIGAYGEIDRATFESESRDSVGEVNVMLKASAVTGNYFYYTNSLPYAERLANGWSAQAEAGWTHAIARNFGRYIREEKKRLNIK